MFSAQTLAKADAARIFMAPPGLQTRTRLTPKTLVEVVTPRRITPADPAWAALAAALKHATVAAAPSEREVRLGVVLEAAGAPIGEAFLSQAEAAENGRVYAVVDGHAGAADVTLARAIAAAA
jgi:hypothetical protein